MGWLGFIRWRAGDEIAFDLHRRLGIVGVGFESLGPQLELPFTIDGSDLNNKLFCSAISLVLGGAIGNVIDRLMHGHVIDFLQFHWSWLAPMFPGGYFPSFNIADAAISLGAVGLIADELRRVKRST